jgi:hypothetical protein
MEGVDVPLGVVPKALSSRGEEVAEEDGCLSFDILFVHV